MPIGRPAILSYPIRPCYHERGAASSCHQLLSYLAKKGCFRVVRPNDSATSGIYRSLSAVILSLPILAPQLASFSFPLSFLYTRGVHVYPPSADLSAPGSLPSLSRVVYSSRVQQIALFLDHSACLRNRSPEPVLDTPLLFWV